MSLLQLFTQHAAPAQPGQPSPYREQFLREQARVGRVLLDNQRHVIWPVRDLGKEV